MFYFVPAVRTLQSYFATIHQQREPSCYTLLCYFESAARSQLFYSATSYQPTGRKYSCLVGIHGTWASCREINSQTKKDWATGAMNQLIKIPKAPTRQCTLYNKHCLIALFMSDYFQFLIKICMGL